VQLLTLTEQDDAPVQIAAVSRETEQFVALERMALDGSQVGQTFLEQVTVGFFFGAGLRTIPTHEQDRGCHLEHQRSRSRRAASIDANSREAVDDVTKTRVFED